MREFPNPELYCELLGEHYEDKLRELRKILFRNTLNVEDAKLLLKRFAQDLEYFSVVKD